MTLKIFLNYNTVRVREIMYITENYFVENHTA
jgi:hypothetical protein